MLQIYCKNINLSKEFQEGSSLLDIYKGFKLEMPYGPVSAKVNNKVEGLTYKAFNNKDVEFLDILSSSGMRTYVRSLFLFYVKQWKNSIRKERFCFSIPYPKVIIVACVSAGGSHWMM